MGWSFEVHNRKKASGAITRNLSSAAARSSTNEQNAWERPAGAGALLAATALLTAAAWNSRKRRRLQHSKSRSIINRGFLADLRSTVNSQLAVLGSLKSFLGNNCRRGLESAGRLKHRKHQRGPSAGKSNPIDAASPGASHVCSSDQQLQAPTPATIDAARQHLTSSHAGATRCNTHQCPPGNLTAHASKRSQTQQTSPTSQHQPRFLDAAAEDPVTAPPTAPRPSKSGARRNKRKGKKGRH